LSRYGRAIACCRGVRLGTMRLHTFNYTSGELLQSPAVASFSIDELCQLLDEVTGLSPTPSGYSECTAAQWIFIFSADETLDVGDEFGSPVTPDYPKSKKFSGEVNWVEIDVDKDAEDLDHLISPEERVRVAMAIQ
jgi:hypothetical protein